jgi:glycine C-acetyltransferase
MSKRFYERIENLLDSLKEEGTYKEYQYLISPMSGKSTIEKYDDVIMLCSNNYLGLADNPQLIESGIQTLKEYGTGAASVRFICGTYDIHRKLENKVAEFLHTEAALTYTSCWNVNTAVIPALLGPGDTVISDELNHASIIDGCRLVSRDVRRLVYRHADLNSLEDKLKQAATGDGVALIVTDGVFSMEGDITPLPGIIELAKKYDAIVMVDDSHGTGVIGETGRGTPEYYDLLGQVDIITGTFGKALGGAGGGFIAGKKPVIDLCIQRSRPHLFSNSLPPVLTSVALAAIEYLQCHPEKVRSLQKKTKYFRENLKKAGITPLEGDSAIIPVMIYDTAKAIRAAIDMLEQGVYVIGFGYPVVPEGQARIRIQVSDALSYEDIDYSINVLKKVLSE